MASVSFAPIKYAKIHFTQGGPIQTLYSKKKRISDDQLGYEAYATIREDILIGAKNKKIYGNHTGTGSDSSLNIAHHKAISEAIERWAFYETMSSPTMEKYGFNLEPTTAGMAAFPGLNANAARQLANWEAIERWSLINWWAGNLPTTNLKSFGPKESCQVLEICTPWGKNVRVVILIKKCNSSNRIAYGFAAHSHERQAIAKAKIELFRNYNLLDKISLSQNLNSLNVSYINEKRLLYFSEEGGFELFQENVSRSNRLSSLPSIPKKQVDLEILGPWSKYCFVWRCLFENYKRSHLDSALPSFYF